MVIIDAKKADTHPEKFTEGHWPLEMYTQASFGLQESSTNRAELAPLGFGKTQIPGRVDTT